MWEMSDWVPCPTAKKQVRFLNQCVQNMALATVKGLCCQLPTVCTCTLRIKRTPIKHSSKPPHRQNHAISSAPAKGSNNFQLSLSSLFKWISKYMYVSNSMLPVERGSGRASFICFIFSSLTPSSSFTQCYATYVMHLTVLCHQCLWLHNVNRGINAGIQAPVLGCDSCMVSEHSSHFRWLSYW